MSALAAQDASTWIVLRAAGVGAFLMFFLSVAYGLAATTSPFGKRVAKPSSTFFHQTVSTVGLVLLAIHLALLLVDRYIPFQVLDLLVPFRTEYRAVAVAFGVVAMYATVLVLVTSYLRKRIGTAVWRASHLLAVPAFTMSLMHGLFAGTDTARPWMWWTYLLTGATVLFLVLVRGLTAGVRAARHAPRPTPAAAPVD